MRDLCIMLCSTDYWFLLLNLRLSCLSVCLSVRQSVSQSVFLSVSQSVSLSVCQSVCPSVCLCVSQCVSVSVCLPGGRSRAWERWIGRVTRRRGGGRILEPTLQSAVSLCGTLRSEWVQVWNQLTTCCE